MDQDGLPAGFTITPYAFEPRAAESKFEAGLGAATVDWWRIGLRIVAAGLAAAAAWAQLIVQEFDTNGPGGIAQFRYNAWGNVSVRVSKGSDLQFGHLSGISYGPLLCAGAAALVIAAVLEWQPTRLRLPLKGATVAGLAAAFLLAVAGCEISYSRASQTTTLGHYLAVHAWAPSWSPWRAIAAFLLAVVSCLRLSLFRLPFVSLRVPAQAKKC